MRRRRRQDPTGKSRTAAPRRPWTPLRRWAPRLAALGAAAAVAGCTYAGQIDQPYTLKATWFSYLNGDDLRKRCANIEDHWEVRLVYNGHYEKQLRSYHMIADGTGGADVTARASKPDAGNLARLSLADPLAPWRWATSRRALDPAARDELEDRLAASGVYATAPSGIRLKSWGWYWVSIACRDGEVHFNAWAYPSDRWDRQDLRQIVQPLDETGVAFNQPRAPDFSESPTRARPKGEGQSIHFELKTGDNGLAGVVTPF